LAATIVGTGEKLAATIVGTGVVFLWYKYYITNTYTKKKNKNFFQATPSK
jgi:hypothetical protein